MATPRAAIIQCDRETFTKIATTLQFAIVGKAIFFSDTLADIVRRHCPEIYQIAEEAGYRFIPSDDKDDLMQVPPNIRFDILRNSAVLN